MISQDKAKQYLNSLTGRAAVERMTTVYLGLSATEPVHANGEVNGEPTAEAAPSYARRLVGGSNATGDNNAFASDPSGGIIRNSKEIQMAAARQEWGKMNYWFLSSSQGRGTNAFLWGKMYNTDGTLGVQINAETVPVFYEGQLQTSIDVALE